MHIVICMDYGNAKSICTYYGDSECVNAFQKGFTKESFMCLRDDSFETKLWEIVPREKQFLLAGILQEWLKKPPCLPVIWDMIQIFQRQLENALEESDAIYENRGYFRQQCFHYVQYGMGFQSRIRMKVGLSYV